jgi:hypothetical protein
MEFQHRVADFGPKKSLPILRLPGVVDFTSYARTSGIMVLISDSAILLFTSWGTSPQGESS